MVQSLLLVLLPKRDNLTFGNFSVALMFQAAPYTMLKSDADQRVGVDKYEGYAVGIY